MLATNVTIVRSITIPVIRNHAGFRDIIIPLVPHENAKMTDVYALTLAKTFGASVTGLAFVFEPAIPVSGPFDTIPADLIEEMVARSEAEASESTAAFEKAARNYGVQVMTKTVHASFRESEDQFAEATRSFDIAIVPQNKPGEESLPNFAEAALFHSGRPILVVPYIQRKELSLSRVLICWDGSRAAARAISDAWPLLERAGNVNVVTIGQGDRPVRLQKELGEHLATHGIAARMDLLAGDDIDAGNAILSYAADTQADVLVMGGYGHSRLREWVLGGVTRTILASMTVPTLLSH